MGGMGFIADGTGFLLFLQAAAQIKLNNFMRNFVYDAFMVLF